MNAMQMILEAYAGKTKEMVRCEGYVREIITAIKEDHQPFNLGRKRKVSREFEPCRQLEKTLEKFLDVGDIKIHWLDGQVNAYTVTSSAIVIANRRINTNFKKAKFHITVFENLVINAELNEREIMGMLLHEIGHCFYYSPLLILSEMTSVLLSPPSAILSLIMQELVKWNDAEMDMLKSRIPFLYNIYSLIGELTVHVQSFLSLLPLVVNPTAVASNIVQKLMNPFSIVAGYGNERGADTFAAKYGYGADLITGLKKVGAQKKTAAGVITHSTGTLGEVWMDLGAIQLDIIAGIILDEHPNNDVRAQTVIRKLERDLANGDYPPEIKKDLEAEIKRTKKAYDTMYDCKGNIELRKGYYQALNLITHGHSDARELLNAIYTKYEY